MESGYSPELAAYIEKLTASNVESDTLALTLEAMKDGLITRDLLDHLCSFPSPVPSSLRRRHLLMHVHSVLQGKLRKFESSITALPLCNAESRVHTLAMEAVRDGLVRPSVLDHLTYLHPDVPHSVKVRYLLTAVLATLRKKYEDFELRSLKIVAYDLKSDALDFVKKAVKAGIIDNSVLVHISSIYPHNLGWSSDNKRMCEVLKRNLAAKEHELMQSTIPHIETWLHLQYSTNSSSIADIPLEIGHLSELNELLVDFAYEWRAIGIAIRFQPQNLNNIQACPHLIQDSPKSYLARLLEDWLLRKHPHTLPPTVNSLKSALCSHAVGLGLLADKIPRFTLHGSVPFNMPYSMIGVASISRHNDVFIEDLHF